MAHPRKRFCLVALKSIKMNGKSVWFMKCLAFFSLINCAELCLRCVQKCMQVLHIIWLSLLFDFNQSFNVSMNDVQ